MLLLEQDKNNSKMASNDKIKKLVAKIRSQSTRLNILNQLFDIDISTPDKLELFKEILLLSTKALNVEQGFIVTYDKNNTNPFEYKATNTTDQIEDKTIIRDICENIIKTQKPVIINDTRLHRRLRRCNIKNIIAMPILSGKTPVGVFIIINKRKQLFKKRDLILFTLICKFTAIAIEHANNETNLDEKNKELATINAIDRIRDTIKDFDTMMEAILQELTQVIKAKLAFFILYNKQTDKTTLKVSGRLKSSTFANNNSTSIYDISRETLNKGELTEFNKVNKDIKTAICTPIVVGDNLLGVFGVINTDAAKGFSKIDKKLLNAVATQSDSAVFEDAEKAKIKSAFQRYVSPEVINDILEDSDHDYMKTDKRELTVLFSDLRGFTALSEKLEPEQVVEILNEHFETMSKIILKNRGTLDKFVGDEIMAVFGAPVYTDTHAIKAVKTALEMQKAQKELSRKFKRKFGIYVEIGIGINTGYMVIGNIGSKERMDYTVIGDRVNVAARLCGVAEAGDILITEDTYVEVKKIVKVKTLNPITVKGKSTPLTVYNVTGLAR